MRLDICTGMATAEVRARQAVRRRRCGSRAASRCCGLCPCLWRGAAAEPPHWAVYPAGGLVSVFGGAQVVAPQQALERPAVLA